MDILSEWLRSEGSVLEQALMDWLPHRRWFRAKSKALISVNLEANSVWGGERDPESGTSQDLPLFCIVKTGFSDTTFERYALPLAFVDSTNETLLPEAALLPSTGLEPVGKILIDASWDPRFRAALYDLLRGDVPESESREAASKVPLGAGIVRGAPVAYGALPPQITASKVLNAEQSNTSFAYETSDHKSYFVKLYRRLEYAVNPEPETLRFLREHTEFPHVPLFHASLEWIVSQDPPGYSPVTLALMQELVEARGDAWQYTVHNLKDSTLSGMFSDWIVLLGKRVAELHNALASGNGKRSDVGLPDSDFTPEPLTPVDLTQVRHKTQALLDAGFASLEKLLDPENGTAFVMNRELIREVLGGRARLEDLLQASPRPDEEALEGALKIRTHGDLHLGQILVGASNPQDLWILDFEGEPGRPLAEARQKQSPLRDVAGMLRSFHYAAHRAQREAQQMDPHVAYPPVEGTTCADTLAESLRANFLKGYADALTLPGWKPDAPGLNRLLDLFVVEKTIYELHYELNNRPDWVEIPLRGLLFLQKSRPPRVQEP